MNLDEYQNKATSTAIYGKEDPMGYCLLGLLGEAGELANKYKKVLRGDKEFNDELKTEMAKEAGDVMWYLAMTAKELGFNLDTIAQMNIEKLNKRKKENTIMGDGDNR
jgi:NTP pyrophosphatase (non-canonical NTP hydrolase)